jgi:hypothetical protein
MSFRDKVREMSPTWLQDGRNERLLFTLALGMDLLVEKAVQAVHMFFPTTCDASALPVIGNDRLIPRGATELESRYRQRLQRAPETWQHAGTPWQVLAQALHILLELRPAARMISNRYDDSVFPSTLVDSKWNSYAAGDDADATQPTRTLYAGGNWDWDSVIRCSSSWTWSRKWIVLESVAPNDWCHQDIGVWGDPDDGVWGDDAPAWGVDVQPEVFDSLWSELLLWGSAHAPVVALIISFDPTHFDPAQPAGGGINPDGTYGRWSKMSGNVQVPTRTAVSNCLFSHRVQ